MFRINRMGFLKMNALKPDSFVRTVFYRKVQQWKPNPCNPFEKSAKETAFRSQACNDGKCGESFIRAL
ncbi:hypothetical protein SAMN03080617_00496 [Algoriphagus alkaliphilus]|uniref:Uncharacterized protein n=1 Tax=Algoriphagus alkaliphilus TaxID=279824 RepID=A0A1G5VF60_9BACT|nr:hypothetical protein [Cyclobacterium sp.]SDA44469.1 hypothetical protein SAMN03080617_00496 [Algoriphagus alkaliphilus]